MHLGVGIGFIVQTLEFISQWGLHPAPTTPGVAVTEATTTVKPAGIVPEVEAGIPPEKMQYWEKGQRVWMLAYEMFTEESIKWRNRKIKGNPGMKFRHFDSKKYKRRIFMTEADFGVPPRDLVEVYWKDSANMASWNPNVLDAGNIEDIGKLARITYQVSKGRGAITSREFLNINFRYNIPNDGVVLAYASLPSYPGEFLRRKLIEQNLKNSLNSS